MNLGMYAIVGTRMNEIKAIKKMKREKNNWGGWCIESALFNCIKSARLNKKKVRRLLGNSLLYESFVIPIHFLSALCLLFTASFDQFPWVMRAHLNSLIAGTSKCVCGGGFFFLSLVPCVCVILLYILFFRPSSIFLVVCQLKVTTMCTAFSLFYSAHAIDTHTNNRPYTKIYSRAQSTVSTRERATRARRVNKRTETNHISNGVLRCMFRFSVNAAAAAAACWFFLNHINAKRIWLVI